MLIFCERKVLLTDWCWWLVLVLCEREILLAGYSEDEANRVLNGLVGRLLAKCTRKVWFSTNAHQILWWGQNSEHNAEK